MNRAPHTNWRFISTWSQGTEPSLRPEPFTSHRHLHIYLTFVLSVFCFWVLPPWSARMYNYVCLIEIEQFLPKRPSSLETSDLTVQQNLEQINNTLMAWTLGGSAVKSVNRELPFVIVTAYFIIHNESESKDRRSACRNLFIFLHKESHI